MSDIFEIKEFVLPNLLLELRLLLLLSVERKRFGKKDVALTGGKILFLELLTLFVPNCDHLFNGNKVVTLDCPSKFNWLSRCTFLPARLNIALANLFGVAKSTVSMCVKEVCPALVYCCFDTYVRFPQGDALTEVVEGYNNRWGFPNCGNTIDGTHFPIIAPSEHHAGYVNRKGWYSVFMQGVCDHRHIFTDFYIGWPGRVHDTRVLANSDVYEQGESGTVFEGHHAPVDPNQEVPVVLLGDPAYPLRQWLQKPFTDRIHLTPEKENFNYRLSRARMTVTDTFGRFKGRCRRFLKRLDVDVNFVLML